MSTIGAYQAALSGLRANLERFESTATRAVTGPLDDLAENLVDLKARQHAVSASARTGRAADEMIGALLDTFG